MSEEAGKGIGSKIGKVIEVGKISLQAEQAKFMRIRVEIPIGKPLRRGGNITTTDDDRCWLTFRYERLPTFCYICGLMGHDDKHCCKSQQEGMKERQYGEWLRAGSVVKNGSEKGKTKGYEGSDSMVNDGAGVKSHRVAGAESHGHGVASNVGASAQTEAKKSDSRNSNKVLAVITALGSEAKSKNSNFSEQDSLDKWDGSAVLARDNEERIETWFRRNENEAGLVEELFKEKEVAMSAANINTCGPGKQVTEVSSPIKFKMEVDGTNLARGLSPKTVKKATGRGKIKRMAREKNVAQGENIISLSPRSGKKRPGIFEELIKDGGRCQKRICGELNNNSPNSSNEIVVAAWQHHREQ